MGKDKLQLKVDLTGNHIDWFHQIQEEYNFQTYAEVIRFAIYTTKETMENRLKTIELEPDQVNLIQKLINVKSIKQQYNVYNSRQFIEVAISKLIDKIRDNSKSILHWDVKTELAGDEKKVAVAFGTCYNNSETKGITIENIAEELGWRDQSKIIDIMDGFVDQFLVKRSMDDGDKVYYV